MLLISNQGSSAAVIKGRADGRLPTLLRLRVKPPNKGDGLCFVQQHGRAREEEGAQSCVHGTCPGPSLPTEPGVQCQAVHMLGKPRSYQGQSQELCPSSHTEQPGRAPHCPRALKATAQLSCPSTAAGTSTPRVSKLTSLSSGMTTPAAASKILGLKRQGPSGSWARFKEGGPPRDAASSRAYEQSSE